MVIHFRLTHPMDLFEKWLQQAIDSKMYEDLYSIAKQYNSDIVKSCFYDNLQAENISKISKAKWNNSIPEDKSFTLQEYPFFLSYHPSVWSAIYKKEFLEKHNIRFAEAPGAGWTDNPFQVQTMCLAERINYTSNAYYYWRRLNINESDDLKDYTIPFKRSDEIHQWIEKNNITDENVLLQLFKRELAYVKIVLSMKNIPDLKNCFHEIKKLINRLPKEKIINNKCLSKKEIKFYKALKNNLQFVYYKLQLKRIRKSLFSIRLNKNGKRLVLFGKELKLLARRSK